MLDEGRRFEEGAVDVALGGEVDDGVDAGDELGDEVGVADVALDEAVALGERRAVDVAQVVEVAGVGQLVEVDDLVVVVRRQEMADEVAADEAGAARDQDLPHRFLAVWLGYPHAAEVAEDQVAAPRLGVAALELDVAADEAVLDAGGTPLMTVFSITTLCSISLSWTRQSW